MSAGYTPQVGTIPHRVIQYLKALRPASKVSTPELCDVLQLDTVGSLGAYMAKALQAGAVRMEYGTSPGSGRRVSLWSLGDGVALQRVPEDDPDDRPAPAPSTSVLLSAWAPPRSVFELAGPHEPVELAPEAARPNSIEPAAEDAAKSVEPAAEPSAFRVALWSNGVLQIQRGDGELLSLSQAETRQLLHYLDRIADTAAAKV